MDALHWVFEEPAWMQHGACRGKDPDDFFVEEGSEDELAGIQTCQRCCVRQECLDYALTKPERYGIWGGLTSKQRDRIRYKRKVRLVNNA